MFALSGQRQARLIFALLAALACALYVIRLTGPTDLEADAQQRNVAYVMDAAWAGHWLVQTEVRGWLMSKPPVHTWLAASFGVIGGVNRLTLTLPSALAVFGLAWLAWWAGRRHFGTAAGVYAGVACVMAPLMARHVALVRTDAVFAFFIMAAALAAYQAWAHTQRWLPFWLAAAAATLTKGPLGLLLAAAGLLAAFWERRTDAASPLPRGSQRVGLIGFFLITLGWLAAAAYVYGHPLIDKLFLEELFGQVTGARKDITPGENLWKPSFFFTLRFLPFSLFALYGLWRVVRHPAADPEIRRFERFLFCWTVVGAAIFSLGAHFRADLLLPLWPPAALLAGREMVALAKKVGARSFASAMVLVVAILLGLAYWAYHPKAMKSKEVRYSVMVDRAGQALAKSVIDPRALLHLDTPPLAMTHLRTYRPWTPEAEIMRRLQQGEALCVAVADPARFPRLFGPEGPAWQVVFRWPESAATESASPAILAVYASAPNGACMRSSRHD